MFEFSTYLTVTPPALGTKHFFKRLIITRFSSVFVFRATLGATNDEV